MDIAKTSDFLNGLDVGWTCRTSRSFPRRVIVTLGGKMGAIRPMILMGSQAGCPFC